MKNISKINKYLAVRVFLMGFLLLLSNNQLFAQAPICTEQVMGETFTAENGVSKTITQPATNNGFVFDILSVDNSFNMNINGVDLASQEMEFASVGTPGINVRFVDGTLYETGTPSIWTMVGTEVTPLMRVVISPTGAVTMFGSKVSGGPLFPLELINGNSFNIINWNAASANIVIISQAVVGRTTITGRGYGVNIVPCPCFNPANTAGPGSDTKVGITLLNRAGADTSDNWPMARKSGHLALESNTKGFLITRVTTAQVNAIQFPQEGMMVYDTTAKCLKLFADGVWACFSQPTCP